MTSDEPRDLAVQALYEMDQRGLDDLPAHIDLASKARRFVAGVIDHVAELDAGITAAASNWRIDRMPVVDRAILRLGFYELRYEPATPVAVIVSEAVRMAKAYSTERSGSFVNGVLATLARAERAQR